MHFPPLEPLGFTYLAYTLMRCSHTADTNLLCSLWQKCTALFRLSLDQRAENFSYREPDSKHLRLRDTRAVTTLKLYHCQMKAAIGNIHMDEHGCSDRDFTYQNRWVLGLARRPVCYPLP